MTKKNTWYECYIIEKSFFCWEKNSAIYIKKNKHIEFNDDDK